MVKKTAYGVDFVIWGLENQARIHYAMPLRHMVGDALSYLKGGAYHFHNSDVNTVFDMSRSIYEEDYEKINAEYKDRRISPELGMVIGAITESQKLIDHALESEEKGEEMNMCNALEKLLEKGRTEGRARGIQAVVGTCKKFKADKKVTIATVMKEFSLSEEEATAYVEKYW